MTIPNCWQAAPWKRLGPVLAAACVLPVLAACGGAAARVQLPAQRASAQAADGAAAGAPATPQQQVTVALTGYTTALGQAEQSKSVTRARLLLRPYVTASRIGGLVDAVSAFWARGDNFYGQDALHILSVRVAGRHAFVHECDNTSSMGLASAATGQAVPGSAGIPAANLVTRLDLVGGHWLVDSQLPEDVPCVP